MVAELPIGVSTGERPLDPTSGGVAPPLPSGHLGGEGGSLGRTARQALTLQHTDFDFGHIQPARMVGRVMKFDPAQQGCRGLHTEDLFEALAQMDVEVVQNQVNLACMRIPAAQHPADESDEVDLGGQRRASLAQQLLALLVHTDHRLARIVGPSIQRQQFVHASAILGGELANAPHQFAPGFEEVFFRIRRMLSRLIVFIWEWRRAACVSSATVQRCAPGGGSEQASAVTCASASAWYVLGLPGRGSSWSAKSSPLVRYAARVRHTAVRPTLSTSMICRSGSFLSKAARMWARLNSRAICRPLDRNSSTIRRSRLFKLSSVCRMPDTPVYLRYAPV